MCQILSIIFYLIFASLPLIEFSEIPLEIPEKEASIRLWDGKKIKIRGFWYPLQEDAGVLTSIPQLKSCCILAPAKVTQQVLVKGEISSLTAQRAATVEGIFRIRPLYNEKGELVQLYVLEEAKEIPSSHFSLWSLFGLLSYLKNIIM